MNSDANVFAKDGEVRAIIRVLGEGDICLECGTVKLPLNATEDDVRAAQKQFMADYENADAIMAQKLKDQVVAEQTVTSLKNLVADPISKEALSIV